MGPGLGVGGRRAEGECRRTRRSPAAMALSNDGSTSCPRASRPPAPEQTVTPPDAFSVGQLLVHRIEGGQRAANRPLGGVSTVVSKRLGLCGATCR